MDALLNAQIKRFGRKGKWNRVFVTTSVSALTYRTDLSITGSGYLLLASTYGSSAGYENQPQLRITIDGGGAYLIGTDTNVYLPAYYESTSPMFGGKVFPFDIPFFASLKVETYNSHASVAVSPYTEVGYILSA